MGKIRKQKYMMAAICLLFIVVWGCANWFSIHLSMQKGNQISIEEGVCVQKNDNPIENVSLKEYNISAVESGDTMILSKILPDVPIRYPVLLLNVSHAVIEVYLDGKMIYQYGAELYAKKQVVGHSYLRIPIMEEFQGKEWKLVLRFTEEKCYSYMPQIQIMGIEDSYRGDIANNILIGTASVILLLFGIAGIFVCFTMRHYDKMIQNLSWIGMFCVIISIWMMCREKMIYLFWDNFKIISLLEHYSLYLSPIPVLIYFAKVQSSMKQRKLLFGIAAIIIGANVTTVFLTCFQIMHYVDVLSLFHILICVAWLAILFCSIHTFDKKKRMEKVLNYGVSFMGVVVILEVMHFNVSCYSDGGFRLHSNFLALSVFLFVLSMFYSYCVAMIESCYGRAERQILERLAYTDSLTGIYNRTKCEDIMRKIEKEDRYAYIINFDLNNLKIVNDTYGHYMGDHMLKAFAGLLQEAFQKSGFIGRMGGDEFVAIIVEKNEQKIVKNIRELENLVRDYNKTNKEDYQISVAIGYEKWCSEKEEKIWECYKQADKKMYDCKKEQKSKEQK